MLTPLLLFGLLLVPLQGDPADALEGDPPPPLVLEAEPEEPAPPRDPADEDASPAEPPREPPRDPADGPRDPPRRRLAEPPTRAPPEGVEGPREGEEGTASVLLGAGAGYGIGTLLPLCGVGAGTGVLVVGFNAAQGSGDACDALAIAIGSVVVATAFIAPSVLACGPCASGGAAVGAGVGAGMGGRELLWPVVGALGGVGTAALGVALMLAGTFVGSQAGELVNGDGIGLGCSAMLLGLTLAVLAGPLAVAGAALADATWGSFTAPRDDAGPLQVRALPAPRRASDDVARAVAY